MTKAAPAQKLALTAPQTIPLDKLSIHDGNVRQIKAGVSIENLAADIARRGLLQSLSVRPLIDDTGAETGRYGVQAGGRRLRALQMLVKQKKLAKNAPVPCIVRSGGFVEADSLAENTEREALHPIDQFRAFAALRDKGQGEDTIAAAFGVTPAVVRQRLRLASASALLLKAYEDDELTLEQLMAFCLVEDRKRQEEVWASLKGHWNSGPDAIRRMLTEKTVRADDRRALFVGAEAYKEAGGIILRDLFAADEDGWLQDVPLLEKLAGEKLTVEAGTIKAEGWGWVEAAIDFPWNHHRAFRPLKPILPALSDEEVAEFEALTAEFEELDQTPVNELTDKAKDQLQNVRELLIHYDNKSPVFDEAQKVAAGAFISLRDDGFVLIERGYVRREDEAAAQSIGGNNCDAGDNRDAELNGAGSPGSQDASGDDEDDDAALPDRLTIELTAYRSLALREALANDPGMAYLAMLHALTPHVLDRIEKCRPPQLFPQQPRPNENLFSIAPLPQPAADPLDQRPLVPWRAPMIFSDHQALPEASFAALLHHRPFRPAPERDVPRHSQPQEPRPMPLPGPSRCRLRRAFWRYALRSLALPTRAEFLSSRFCARGHRARYPPRVAHTESNDKTPVEQAEAFGRCARCAAQALKDSMEDPCE